MAPHGTLPEDDRGSSPLLLIFGFRVIPHHRTSFVPRLGSLLALVFSDGIGRGGSPRR